MKKIALLLLVFLIISSILFVSLNYVVHSVEHKKRVDKKRDSSDTKNVKNVVDIDSVDHYSHNQSAYKGQTTFPCITLVQFKSWYDNDYEEYLKDKINSAPLCPEVVEYIESKKFTKK